MTNDKRITETPVQIKIVKEIADIYPQYMPKLGKIYQAKLIQSKYKGRPLPPICVIVILGKKILVRKDEYEIIGGE